MDFPIAEKQPDALQRVTQALRDGVHQIDSDDVKQIIQELSSSRNMEIKTLLASYAELESRLDVTRLALDASQGRVLQLENQQESSLAAYREKCEAVMELNIRIKDLETQLFHFRVLAGGSTALLGGAISIRDRMVDYFRYVEEAVPFAKTAESRERGAAIVDGMKWLIQEAESSRLAAQAVKAQRNQLEAKLAEAQVALDASQGISRAFDHQNMQLTTQVRAMKEHAQELQIALDASQGQVKQLESEVAELSDLAARQADLLSRTAVAIRGPEPELARWSHYDLPELAQQMRDQRNAQAELLKVGQPAG